MRRNFKRSLIRNYQAIPARWCLEVSNIKFIFRYNCDRNIKVPNRQKNHSWQTSIKARDARNFTTQVSTAELYSG